MRKITQVHAVGLFFISERVARLGFGMIQLQFGLFFHSERCVDDKTSQTNQKLNFEKSGLGPFLLSGIHMSANAKLGT